jgi:hypothetical protein
MILRTGGALYLNSTVHESDWDEYDDMALIETARHTLSPDVVLRQHTAKMLDEHRDILRRTNVFSFNDGGAVFVNIQNWTYLLADGIRQLANRIERYDQELIRLGADPEKLALPS